MRAVELAALVVPERRKELDSAAASFDYCEFSAKVAAAGEDAAQRRTQAVAQQTSSVVKLPILENEVQSDPFFKITPWLIVAVYVYLRLYLSQLQKRLGAFDVWGRVQNWCVARRAELVHPWVGTFAFYRNPVACGAMFVGATWGTPCGLALMYEWQPNGITHTALIVSIAVALRACIESRNPCGIRIVESSKAEEERLGEKMQTLAIWGIWVFGSVATVAFLWAHIDPSSWQRTAPLVGIGR